MKNLLPLLCKKTPLKIIVFCIACGIWNILQNVLITENKCIVPLYFYNTSDTYTIAAPDSVQVVLKGPKQALRALDNDLLALHIDARSLKPGNQWHAPSAGKMFLPNSVSVIYYNPALIAINLKTLI